jgi:hypothetical protein
MEPQDNGSRQVLLSIWRGFFSAPTVMQFIYACMCAHIPNRYKAPCIPTPSNWRLCCIISPAQAIWSRLTFTSGWWTPNIQRICCCKEPRNAYKLITVRGSHGSEDGNVGLWICTDTNVLRGTNFRYLSVSVCSSERQTSTDKSTWHYHPEDQHCS